LIGAYLNCMLIMPAQCYYASGLLAPLLKISSFALLLLLPFLFLTIPLYHSYAAALSWLLLNLGLFFFQVWPLFVQVMPGHRKIWYFHDILIPAVAALLAPLAAYVLCSMHFSSQFHFAYFLPIIALSLLTSAWMALRVMSELRQLLKSQWTILAKII